MLKTIKIKNNKIKRKKQRRNSNNLVVLYSEQYYINFIKRNIFYHLISFSVNL